MGAYYNQFGGVVYTTLLHTCRACFNGKRHACKQFAVPMKFPLAGYCQCRVCAQAREIAAICPHGYDRENCGPCSAGRAETPSGS